MLGSTDDVKAWKESSLPSLKIETDAASDREDFCACFMDSLSWGNVGVSQLSKYLWDEWIAVEL